MTIVSVFISKYINIYMNQIKKIQNSGAGVYAIIEAEIL